MTTRKTYEKEERQTAYWLMVGNLLRTARESLQMTQGQVASLVGLTRTSILNIEQGRQSVSAYRLACLSEILNLDARLFFFSKQTLPTSLQALTEEANILNDIRKLLCQRSTTGN